MDNYLKSLVFHVSLWSESLQSSITLESRGVSERLHRLRGLVADRVRVKIKILKYFIIIRITMILFLKIF
jgi:hypothetical protein